MEELNDFISQSLFEITQGVREANEKFNRARGGDQSAFELMPGPGNDQTAGIHFDVAVTTKTEAGASGGAKVNIKVVEASAGGKGQRAWENVSRLRFTVRIGLQVM